MLSKSFELYGLGDLNFHKKAFATKNFHCGYYEDGYLLNDILHFRKNTLIDYFKAVKNSIPLYQKASTFLLKPIIKKYLLGKSEPYQAYINNDTDQINRFFN